MAGFEAIVRPVVFPNIRPTPKQSVRPNEAATDDPEKGFCVIRGTSGKIVQLSQSYSSSTSQERPTEIERRSDEVRVYQKKDDGSVNRENFVDIDVANRIKMRTGKGPQQTFKGFTGDDVVPTIPGRGYTGDDIKTFHYKRLKEADNIEIKKKDKVEKNEEGE